MDKDLTLEELIFVIELKRNNEVYMSIEYEIYTNFLEDLKRLKLS